MITFRMSAEVNEDRRVLVVLPPEVPVGKAELVVTVAAELPEDKKPGRTSLADWAEANAENWGNRLNSEKVDGFTGRRF